MGPFGGAGQRSAEADSKESASRLVSVLASVLQRLIEMNSGSPIGPVVTRAAMFNSSTCPPISVTAYLARIQKYANCSDSCFVVALIYVDRLIELRNIVLTSLNVHRIIITSILLATKSLDDVSFNNSYFAKLGGISSKEINLLECEFLCLVNYSLYVHPEAYDKYCQELRNFSPPVVSHLWNPSESEMYTNPYHYPQVHPHHTAYAPFHTTPHHDHSFFSVPLSMNKSTKTVEDETYAQSYFSSGAPYSMVSQAVPNVNPSTAIAISPRGVALLASYYSSGNCYVTPGTYEKHSYPFGQPYLMHTPHEYSAFDPQSYVFPFGIPRCCGKAVLECALR